MKQNPLPLRDAWIIWFVLGLVMLNYPFLHIFNKDVQLFGIPLTVLYFFIGWPVSIFVIYLFSSYMSRETKEDSQTSGEKQSSSRNEAER
ncbi:MAG: hypothetical protein JRF07_01515 [Deltaproteobacteria bacterium]|jgi:uncharacterized membrane-anchored protein|nr:hypothetical protein [Deltaproteobacteria bacterium]